MTEPAVCMPLGFGRRGDPTTIRWDGERYECIPFHIEVPGVEVIVRCDSMLSAIEHESTDYHIEVPGIEVAGGCDSMFSVIEHERTDVMIRRDHSLSGSLRPVVSRPEAQRLIELLEPGDSGATDREAPQQSSSWILEEAARLSGTREPEELCRFLRLVGRSDRILGFAERRVVVRLGSVILAELAHVMGTSVQELQARVGLPGVG